MRSVLVILAFAALAPAARADSGATSTAPTQQPGILAPTSLSPDWLLGSALQKIQVSHSMSFGYASGGAISGPSGLYATQLAYPVRTNLNLSARFGMEWNPALADLTEGSPTTYGLRELSLDWQPSTHTHVSIGYVTYPSSLSSYLLGTSRRSTWGGGAAAWGPTSP